MFKVKVSDRVLSVVRRRVAVPRMAAMDWICFVGVGKENKERGRRTRKGL